MTELIDRIPIIRLRLFCYALYAVNCSSPPAMDGVIVEPYNDTTEGAMIYFHCSTESTNEERKRVVCGSHGTWSPHSMEGI